MKEKLEYMLEKSCLKIYKTDRYLINNRVSERAIVFRFGLYLQRLLSRDKELKFYNLDNEYNRNGQDPKRTSEFENGTYPDLIIHQRGNNNNNICIIECKTEWNSDTKKDIKKIKDFINPKGQYKYKYGVSIIFERNMIKIKMLENGKNELIKNLYIN